MKRILMINLPYAGHTNCTLSMAKELVERGYDVGYINAPNWRDRIEATGCKFIPYMDYPEDISTFQASIKCYVAAYKTALAVGKDYDVIIYEMFNFLGKQLAQELNKPVIRLFATIAINEKVKDDFMNSSPVWFHLKYRSVSRVVTMMCTKGIKTNIKHVFDAIVNDIPEVNIVFTVKEFQAYLDEFDHRFHFVGPSIAEGLSTLNIPFDEMKYPIIYISSGTLYNNNIKFFKKCINAFKEKQFTVILSTGNGISVEKLGELSDNIYVYPYVPQDEVFKRASLFITHAGINSVNEAMCYGIPMIAAPVAFDMHTNAEKIEQLNLGRKINGMKITEEEIYKLAIELMNNKSIAEGTKHMKEIIEQSNGPKKAADIVENYINKSKIKGE